MGSLSCIFFVSFSPKKIKLEKWKGRIVFFLSYKEKKRKREGFKLCVPTSNKHKRFSFHWWESVFVRSIIAKKVSSHQNSKKKGTSEGRNKPLGK